jgi:hypothetical protein
VSAPKRGQFTLHARAVAPLKAGDYVLTGTQQVAGGDVAPYDGHLRVSSPRYAMPPDQILSTFPPANAEGSFENRLPQIVLKRRTLPWDRRAGVGEPDSMPWLALVVIAEGEGQLSGETPVAQCITPGETLAGEADVPTSVYLAVSQTVVDAVFPTKQDVALLAHVRQVDPSDTELALGDDDGFLAVVMANRLPQFHRSTGPGDPDRPVRYLACLINLEKQLKVLPKPRPPAFTFEVKPEVSVMNLAQLAVTTDTDHYVMGGLAAASATFHGAGDGDGVNPAERAAGLAGNAAAAAARPVQATATSTTASAASWQTAPAKVAQVAVSAAAEEAGRLVRDTMGMNFRYNVEHLVTFEPTYRFPVLAHWSFTATEGGSFETYLQGLDVGLLGTAAPPAPAPPPGTPPATEPTRPPVELTDTGHLGLAHQTRRGDTARAWYRGPLTPRPSGVDPQHPAVRLPLAHTSDQLRRVTPDGREDLSLAAAFEIGRLLALSQPSVVAAQLRWRREQFGASRAHRFVQSALTGLARFGLAVTKADRAPDLGRLLGREVTLAAAADPQAVLAPSRPLADPGRPIELDGGVDELIAGGFGIPLDAVRGASSQIGLLAALRQADVPVVADERGGFDRAAAEQLRRGLTDSVARLFGDAAGSRDGDRPVGAPIPDGDGPVGAPRPADPTGDGGTDDDSGRDVLDQLILAAEREVARRDAGGPDGATGNGHERSPR